MSLKRQQSGEIRAGGLCWCYGTVIRRVAPSAQPDDKPALFFYNVDVVAIPVRIASLHFDSKCRGSI